MTTEVKHKLSDYLTARQMAELEKTLKKFPADQKQSATLEALHLVQEDKGWITEDMMRAIADYLELPHVVVYEVATFYSMYNLKLTGKHRIDVCTNLSCMLNRSKDIVKAFEEKLDIKLGETTSDGQFTLNDVECLGACVNAPVCQVGKKYYEHLTPEKVDAIIEECRNG